ncbi:MAG: energy coupling factor transporter S component ThiW, partial [Halanaerobium sp. MSAO_Bac5]
MKMKKLTFAALLIALGTISGHLIYIPVGIAKAFPVQHLINVLSAVLLGPAYAVWNAFAISLFRNILGTGSLLAFPGSMIGAFLAAYLYKFKG